MSYTSISAILSRLRGIPNGRIYQQEHDDLLRNTWWPTVRVTGAKLI
jgi:hypothetical protein